MEKANVFLSLQKWHTIYLATNNHKINSFCGQVYKMQFLKHILKICGEHREND